MPGLILFPIIRIFTSSKKNFTENFTEIIENMTMYSFDFNYAGFTVEAAQDEEGGIWISTPTIENLLDYRKDSTREKLSSKTFKGFAGKGFQLGKCRSKSTKYNNLNTYYSEETFLKLVYFEVSKGNQKAISLVISGFITDFHSSTLSALGIQLTEEKREYLRQLVHDRIQGFRAWTDIIQSRHIKFYGCKPEGWYYGKLVRKANLSLFGVSNFGSDRTANMTKEQQELVKEFEGFLRRMANNKPNMEPEALLDYCLEVYS